MVLAQFVCLSKEENTIEEALNVIEIYVQTAVTHCRSSYASSSTPYLRLRNQARHEALGELWANVAKFWLCWPHSSCFAQRKIITAGLAVSARSRENERRIREEPPAWITRIFYSRPLLHIFDNPMTRFVDRVNTANQSIDRNKKLPANLAGKSHCDTDTIWCSVGSMAVK